MSGSLQAGGEAVLEGLFLASTAGISSRLVSCSGVLEEEDCVLEDLSFLHSALSRFLGQKQRRRQRESITCFSAPILKSFILEGEQTTCVLWSLPVAAAEES